MVTLKNWLLLGVYAAFACVATFNRGMNDLGLQIYAANAGTNNLITGFNIACYLLSFGLVRLNKWRQKTPAPIEQPAEAVLAGGAA